jgi:hypothetical protein
MVIGIKKCLERKSSQTEETLCLPLLKALLAGLENRLQEVLTSKEYGLASLLLPKYKNYVLPECNLSAIKQELYAAVKKFADMQRATEQIIVAS